MKWSNIMFCGQRIFKTPLQIQLVITSQCNRHCPWCIEKENMSRHYQIDDSRFLNTFGALLAALNLQEIPYNVVITGGEPTLNPSLTMSALDICQASMPLRRACQASDDGQWTHGYKVGINSNGDTPESLVYRHPRLNYIDISYIDTMRDASAYSVSVPIRLQTVLRRSAIQRMPAMSFIDHAIDRHYDSVMFRQCVGRSRDKLDIFDLEAMAANDLRFHFDDYQINVYDLWTKYIYQGREVYFKRQDIEAQQVFERINQSAICSLVMWPDGRLTKSWNYTNTFDATWPRNDDAN